jgi:hypothetical protein
MADTKMQTLSLLENPPFVLNFPGQLAESPEKGYGIADSYWDSRRSRQGAEPWRYFTYLWRFAVTTAGFVMAADTSIDGFDAGVGDDYPSSQTNGALSLIETDLNKEGAFVKNSDQFSIKSLGISFDDPCEFDADSKTYGAWLDYYAPRLQAAVMANSALTYKYGDDECVGDLGLARFWPQHAAMKGGAARTNGEPIGIAVLMPLRRPLITGGKDSDSKITITAKTSREYTVEADGVYPIPGTVTSVVLPMVVIAYGNAGRAFRCAPACMTADGRILAVPLDPHQETAPASGMGRQLNPYSGK